MTRETFDVEHDVSLREGRLEGVKRICLGTYPIEVEGMAGSSMVHKARLPQLGDRS